MGLSLRKRRPSMWLVAATVIVAGAFLGTSLYSNHVARGIDEMAADIAVNADPSLRYLSDARTELHSIGDLLTSAIVDGPQARLPHGALDSAEEKLRDDLRSYVALPFFPAERDRWAMAAQYVRDAETAAYAVADRLDRLDFTGAAAIRAGPLRTAMTQADTALAAMVAFDADEVTRMSGAITTARHHAQHVSDLLDGAAVALALVAITLASRAARQHVRSLESARDAERELARNLEAVAKAAGTIAEVIPRSDRLGDVLQPATEVARTLVGADYCAIGMGTAPESPFDPFVHSGMDESLERTLGHPPRPVGVLGAVMLDARTLRLADVTKDARHRGLPAGHPPVGPFLGVVLRSEREVVGHLYLARAPGRLPFTEQDQRVIELLAGVLGTIVKNAELYGAIRGEVAAREDLLAIVSHDLRNPLSAVTLAAANLARGATESGTKRYVDLVQRNAARMDRLIADLLAAAKLRQGKLAIEPAALETRSLVLEAIDTFAYAAAEKSIALRAAVAAGAPPVYGDRGRILQILANLIGNALKFTPRGGSVVVSATLCEGDLLFSVHDTGVGISPEAAEHVFDRFWQKKEHAARGTGLGLFIAKGLVESHRGRIWVDSRPGEGSDFQFTIPSASWPLSADEKRPAPEAD